MQPRVYKTDRLRRRPGQFDLVTKTEEIEIDLKDRRATQVALWFQLFDYLLKRHVLIRVRIERGLSHPRQQFAKAGVARQIRAQRKVVQKEPNQFFGFGPRAIGDRRANDDVFLRGVVMKQNLEPGQQSHEQRDAFALTERDQGMAQLS